jgi:D-alanyl-D-alanine dipeptidase
MKKLLFIIFPLVMMNTIFVSCSGNPYAASGDISPVAVSTQMILVITKDWKDSTGILYRYERKKPGEKWVQVGYDFPVSIGKAGLAWGIGLQGYIPGEGPVKHEGDDKAPAGVFRLSGVFGYAPSDSTGWLNMPYTHTDSCIECVDDINSKYYNTIIDDREVSDKDWNSSEIMKLRDNEYEWGIFVDHNYMPRLKGGGSCIFMHIWEGKEIPTSGCSAMDEANLIRILHWLNIKSVPVLVQLPQKEYEKFKAKWELP